MVLSCPFYRWRTEAQRGSALVCIVQLLSSRSWIGTPAVWLQTIVLYGCLRVEQTSACWQKEAWPYRWKRSPWHFLHPVHGNRWPSPVCPAQLEAVRARKMELWFSSCLQSTFGRQGNYEGNKEFQSEQDEPSQWLVRTGWSQGEGGAEAISKALKDKNQLHIFQVLY